MIVLRRAGYEVAVAATGEEGLALVRRLRPALVLLDVGLPDVRGTEVCRQIKADPALQDVFVVLISGEAVGAEDKVAGLDEGADEYLTKPIGAQELRARIRTCLRLRDATTALRAEEARLRLALEATEMVTWECDIQTGAIRYSSNLSVIVRSEDPTPYDTVGRLLQQIHPEDRRRFGATLQRAVAANGPFEREHRIGLADGTYRWIRTQGRALAQGNAQSDRVIGISQDITERRQAAAALAHSQRLQATLLQHIPDAAWLKDCQGKVLACNEPLARFFGRSAPEIVGRTVYEIAPEPVAVEMMREDEQTLASGKGTVFEGRWCDELGRLRWFETIKSPLFDGRGQVVGTVGIARDISDRKWAAEQLQQQRDLSLTLNVASDLRAAVGCLTDCALRNEGVVCAGVYLLELGTGSPHLVARQARPSVCPGPAVCGASARLQRLAVRLAAERRPGPEGTLEQVEAALQGEELPGWKAIPIPAGERAVALLCICGHSGQPIPAASLQAIQIIAAQARTTFARLAAEETLRAARQMNEQMLASLRSVVFVLDAAAGTIMGCNPAASRVFGYRREELVGRGVASLYPGPQELAHFQAQARSPLPTPEGLPEFEATMRRADGACFPAEHKLTAIWNEQGQVVNWVCAIRDVTTHKRVEAELRAVSQRIIAAQEGERSRVARELHDGVNQILAAVRLQLRRLEEGSPGLSLLNRETLARSSELLGAALEENRRIAHNLRPGDLNALGFTAACESLCQQFQEQTNLPVRLRLAPLKQRLPANVELNLFRIIQEALTNVAKHAAAKTVRVTLGFQGRGLRLVVQDDGRGFSPHVEPPGKGHRTGIGLASLQERAASLGGTCEIKSAPGCGTVVTIRVPGKTAP
jgi:PAS domain S-box-containing protein